MGEAPGRYRRIKHGEMPGDISRRSKIRLREMRTGEEVMVFPWQILGVKAAKAFFRYCIRVRERAVLKRRWKRDAAADDATDDVGTLSWRVAYDPDVPGWPWCLVDAGFVVLVRCQDLAIARLLCLSMNKQARSCAPDASSGAAEGT